MKSLLMSFVGALALTAVGFPLNPSFTPEAVKEYKAKADAGDAEAQYLYSRALANGLGITMDRTNAFVYAKMSADQGYERAFRRVGLGYEQGWGVEANPVKAAECFSRFVVWAAKAAEQGDADASCNLGYMYQGGQGVVTNLAEAVLCYRKAAEQGDATAQCCLACCYANGIGVAKDMAEAVKWYRKAAEQGDATAQWCMGWCYAHGDNVEKDYAESVKWTRRAAEQGNAEAQCWLGCCYADGKGVAKDMTEALRWFRKSAEQGNRKAQRNLGWCYANGEGVSKDAVEAKKWYDKAANGDVVLRAFFNHGDALVLSLVLFLLFCSALVVFAVEYPPGFAVCDLRMKRSRCWRLYYRSMVVVMPIGSLLVLAAAAFLCCLTDSSHMAKAGFGLVDRLANDVRLYFSVFRACIWMYALVMSYGAIRFIVKWRRMRTSTEQPRLTYGQYVKLQVVMETSVILAVGLHAAFVLALADCWELMWLALFGTAAVMPATLPTRKRFAKLMGENMLKGVDAC